MREGGVEPPRPLGHTDLNRARLPIPPLAQVTRSPPSRRRAKSNADYRTQTFNGLSNRGAGVFRHLDRAFGVHLGRALIVHLDRALVVLLGRALGVGWLLPDSAASSAVRWQLNPHLTTVRSSPSGKPHPNAAPPWEPTGTLLHRAGAVLVPTPASPASHASPFSPASPVSRREVAIWCDKRAEVAIPCATRPQTGTRLPPRAGKRT